MDEEEPRDRSSALDCRRSTCGIILLFALTTTAFADTQTFEIEPAHTSVQFELRRFFGEVTGRFHQVRGILRIDPEQPENSSVVASCPASTVETANRARDTDLRRELFEVEKFPTVSFRSNKVVRTAQDQADMTGDLTLHGVTHPIVLHVTLVARTKNSTGMEVSRWRATGGNFSRHQFGLLWPPAIEAASLIGDEVTLRIECEAKATE